MREAIVETGAVGEDEELSAIVVADVAGSWDCAFVDLGCEKGKWSVVRMGRLEAAASGRDVDGGEVEEAHGRHWELDDLQMEVDY